jgi:tetratricopeptide (TPR) repeat protein
VRDHAGAMEQYAAAAELQPNYVPLYQFQLGLQMESNKDFAGAARHFEAALRDEPDFYEAIAHLADCYLKVNRQREAVAIMQDLVQKNNAVAQAHLDFARILQAAGATEQARKELSLTNQLDPNLIQRTLGVHDDRGLHPQ